MFYCRVASRKRRVPGRTLQSMLVYVQVNFMCCITLFFYVDCGIIEWMNEWVSISIQTVYFPLVHNARHQQQIFTYVVHARIVSTSVGCRFATLESACRLTCPMSMSALVTSTALRVMTSIHALIELRGSALAAWWVSNATIVYSMPLLSWWS